MSGFGLVWQLNWKKSGAKLKEAMCVLTYIVLQFLCERDTEVVLHISRGHVSTGSVRATSSPGSSPLQFSSILILNSKHPGKSNFFFLCLSLAFPLATAASEDRGKARAILPPPPFPHPDPYVLCAALPAPSMHFPTAASPVLQLKIPLWLLELGCELARHPPEILRSAFPLAPFLAVATSSHPLSL